jgi:hypothetical protein
VIGSAFWRLLCHESYGRIYLSAPRRRWVCWLHYLLVGESRGYLPNPFFDPDFFKQESGSRSLLRYVLSRSLWRFKTSERFDPSWYRRAAGIADDVNPLVDFWDRGFEVQTASAETFDTAFVIAAVCRDQAAPRAFLHQTYAQSAWRPPTTPSALRSLQDAFVKRLDFKMVSRKTGAWRRHLVFVQAGTTFDALYIADPRSFDVLINFYETPPSVLPPADHIVVQTGTKATSIRQILEKDASLLAHYDAVLFLDDDVVIDGVQIETLFRIFSEERLDLAQASLTSTSGCYFSCLKQPEAGVAVTKLNAVEIMMPLLSRRALTRFGWIFAESVSGWGIDFLLGAKIREAFGETVALIGQVVAAHERPVDVVDGRFYKFLRANGIDANTEAGAIIRDYALRPEVTTIMALPAASDLPGRLH